MYRPVPRPLILALAATLAACCNQTEDRAKAPDKAEATKPAKAAPAPAKVPPKDTASNPDAPARPPEPAVPPGPPSREASREEVERAIRNLNSKVEGGVADPRNPWAMAHGLLAFGPELKARDGRLAIDVIVGDFARVETVGSKKVYGFPTHAPSKTIVNPQNPAQMLDVPVEPHPDLLLKSLVEVGVPLDRKFKLKSGKRITLKKLVDDAAWAFEMPRSDQQWHKFAWSAGLFLAAYGPNGTVRSHQGDFRVGALISHAVQRLEHDQAFLLALKAKGRPDLLQKRKQGIYGHTCGGLHFVQTAVLGAARTQNKGDIFRSQKQLELVEFRWDAERRIYREMIRTQPKYRFLLLVQEMKFHGHVLETLAMAHRSGVLKSTPATQKLARRVAADLIDAVRELEPMYAAQDKLEKTVPQSYFDLIGDGCHAIRGLREGLTAFFPTKP